MRIADQGAGIPKMELKQIFKRFYRVPGVLSNAGEGHGLGLFIVRSVAERHGGRVWAESEGPGHGSTFTLQLPGSQNEQSPHSGRREASGGRVAFQPGSEGYKARSRRAARPPWHGWETHGVFDVCLLDVMLPGKNGFAVMSELREAGKFFPCSC